MHVTETGDRFIYIYIERERERERKRETRRLDQFLDGGYPGKNTCRSTSFALVFSLVGEIK